MVCEGMNKLLAIQVLSANHWINKSNRARRSYCDIETDVAVSQPDQGR